MPSSASGKPGRQRLPRTAKPGGAGKRWRRGEALGSFRRSSIAEEDRRVISATSAPDAAPAVGAAGDDRAASVARQYFLVAAAFLVVALAGHVATSWQLVFPDFLQGEATTSFGRLLPIANNSLVLGWLAIGLIGAGYPVVAGGRELWGGRLASLTLVIAAAGTAAGLVALALGETQGVARLELPSWADGIVAVAFVLAALIVTRTVGDGATEVARPAVWFVVAGTWWAALGFVAGSIPGLTGFNLSIQAAFFFSAFQLGGLLVLAVGLAYHVAGDLGGPEAARGSRLSNVGFWSLVFVAGWVGPRLLAVGPGPGWLATIGAVFSIVLVVPALVILTDLGSMIRDRWPALRSLPAVRLGVLGAGLLLALVLQNVVQALRSSATVVQFTTWETAFDYLLLYGVLTTWLLAFAIHTRRGGAGGHRWAATHWWLTAAGLGVALTALWLAGLQQGYTWVGAANSGEFENFGAGFVNSVRPLEAWFWLSAIGVSLLAVGLLGYLSRLLVGRATSPEPEAAVSPVAADGDEPGGGEEPEPVVATPIALRVLVQGALGLFVLALLAIFITPITEQANVTESLVAEERAYPDGSPEARGRAVYVSEGCWYCHTQQVRAVVPDVGLGPVSVVGDYAGLTPPPLGVQRIGPDLAYAGRREPTSNESWLRNHLVAPRYRYESQASRTWSAMPSYSYLSADDLDDLAQYIASLR